MSTYFEFSEPSQDISQDSRVPSQQKLMDIPEDNEYYEDEVEDSAILDGGDEEEEGDAWDDSALIAAWDIAVKEYQDFHSIKVNKTNTKGNKLSNTIPTSSINKVIETEESVNVGKEDNSSTFDINEGASTSMKTSVKEQKQNVQKPPEQKIKETGQRSRHLLSISTHENDCSILFLLS
ncbi:hypothetical protein C1646_277261 [Rhizophagus diaphanus]|nr:hypothetical protein C1646_277261 [Rhizophagus diaphanus] [Rhizophagus sp. MUCL 43196]